MPIRIAEIAYAEYERQYGSRCGTLERSGASPFTVQLRCRPLPLSPNKSVEIVRSVLNELSDRAGFDSWWREIDTNTRNDLEDTLKLKVNAQLEAH